LFNKPFINILIFINFFPIVSLTHAENFVMIQNSSTNYSQNQQAFYILENNHVDLGGLQFDLSDDPDVIDIINVEIMDSTLSNFIIAWNISSPTIIIVSMTGDVIPPTNRCLLKVEYLFKDTLTSPTEITLNLENLIIV